MVGHVATNLGIDVFVPSASHSRIFFDHGEGNTGFLQFERSTAGLAVYDYDDAGHLTAARIYDDIPVNPFSQPGLVYKNWDLIASRIRGAGCDIGFVPTAETTPLEIKKQLLF